MSAGVRWGRAPDFAEVAEALEVRTDQILGTANRGGRGTTVLFTPGEPEGDVYAGLVERDADGILRETGRALVPGYWDGLRRRIEEGLG